MFFIIWLTIKLSISNNFDHFFVLLVRVVGPLLLEPDAMVQLAAAGALRLQSSHNGSDYSGLIFKEIIYVYRTIICWSMFKNPLFRNISALDPDTAEEMVNQDVITPLEKVKKFKRKDIDYENIPSSWSWLGLISLSPHTPNLRHSVIFWPGYRW